jgi:ERCC4-type nuclease
MKRKINAYEAKEILKAVANGAEVVPAPKPVSLRDWGLGSRTAKILLAAGYGTVAKVKAASDEELEAINGISKKRIKAIRGLAE